MYSEFVLHFISVDLKICFQLHFLCFIKNQEYFENLYDFHLFILLIFSLHFLTNELLLQVKNIVFLGWTHFMRLLSYILLFFIYLNHGLLILQLIKSAYCPMDSNYHLQIRNITLSVHYILHRDYIHLVIISI